MKFIFILTLASCLVFASCGKGTNNKNAHMDTSTIDTASVEQLEQELKNLEEQSSKVNQKIDSVDNLLNE